MRTVKKFIYLVSPNNANYLNFLDELENLFKTKKIKFFQLRLKKEKRTTILSLAKKIKKVCNKYKVNFIINDDPYLAKKVGADGCHIGQKDIQIKEARKILN